MRAPAIAMTAFAPAAYIGFPMRFFLRRGFNEKKKFLKIYCQVLDVNAIRAYTICCQVLDILLGGIKTRRRYPQ